MISKHLIISGRVQGVSYRAWFSDLARTMNLQGWVRNRSDRTVEAVIKGKPDDVNALIKAAHIGPTLADVKNVDTKDMDYDGPPTFEITASQ